VFATFRNAGFATFYADSAQRIRKFGLAGAQSGAQSADVGTVAADSVTAFVSHHIKTIRCTFFAVNNASQASVNAVFYISHFLKVFNCDFNYAPQRHKGHKVYFL
jgi:hypothetical protein